LISVIIPVFNNEDTLEGCIKSICKNNGNNIEIIMIDDESEDNSGKIIADFAKRDSRIIYQKKEHGGPSAARNRGLDMATGEYICFVDADDLIAENAINTMRVSLGSSDLVIGNVRKRNSPIITENGVINREQGIRMFFGEKNERILGTVYGKLYRKELISFRFDENIYIGEDALFLLDYLLKCNEITLITNEIYIHNINSHGIIESRNADFYFSGLLAAFKMHERVREENEVFKFLATEDILKTFCHISKKQNNREFDEKAIKAITAFFCNTFR